MKTNRLSENRALLQVLAHAENTPRPPCEIVASALAGGVVVVFTDELLRFSTRVLLPSPLDLQRLAVLIAEGFFAPLLSRTVGDHLPQPTIVAESGCFEPLALVVLLFPDCFADAPAADGLNGSDVSMDSLLAASLPASAAAVPGDVLVLHELRTHVGLALLKSVNEVLHDADVWRLRTAHHKTAPALSTARAILAQYYELKVLLLCCLESARRAYADESAPSPARLILADLFPLCEQRRLFELRIRPAEAEAAEWFDAALAPLAALGLQAHLSLLASAAARQEPRGAPRQLLHRPPAGAGAAALCLPRRAWASAAGPPPPRLPLRPGELALLLPGGALLYDAAPSPICALVRRAAHAKLSPAQQRDAEQTLAAHAWRNVDAVAAECVRRAAASDAYVLAVLERNSGFAARLVHWLHEDAEGGAAVADEFVERVVRSAAVGTPAALFIREVGSAGGLRAAQFHEWVARSLPELAVKPPATMGQFAAVVAFTLAANRSWELPEDSRDAAMQLCVSHKQQPDCALLLSVLRRSKSD